MKEITFINKDIFELYKSPFKRGESCSIYSIDFRNFDLSILIIISTNVRSRLICLKINNYDHNVYHIPYILTNS